MTGALYRLAQFCIRQRFIVIGAWVAATIALVVVSQQLGNDTNDSSSLPGTNSQQATSTLQKPFPAIANGTSPVIFHAHRGS